MTFRIRTISALVATLAIATPAGVWAGNEPSLYLTRAANLVAQEQFTEAIELYTQILDGDTPNAEDRGAAYFQRGIAEQEIGMTGHAIADFTQAIWLGHLDNKQLATAHYRRGKGYSLLKQYSRAITDFDRAIQLEPAFAQAYSERGDAYRNRGIYKLALQDYSTSIRLLNPELHVPYFGRGLTHEAMGNERLAAADFRRASELKPDTDVPVAQLTQTPEVQLASTATVPGPSTVSEAEPAIVDDGPPTQVEVAAADAPHPPSQEETADVTPPSASDTTSEMPLTAPAVEPPTVPAEPHQVAMADPAPVHASAEPDRPQGAPINDLASKSTTPASDSNEAGVVAKLTDAPHASSTARDEIRSAEVQNVVTPTDNEPTGAIAAQDRQVSATDLREEQRELAMATPASNQAQKAAEPAANAPTPQAAEATKMAAFSAQPETGRFLVQIASYREKDDALRRFDKLASQHSDLLSALAPDILKADLGDKGVYYRLRLGPFDSFDRSTDLCNALKERQLDCLVIQRKISG